jgi:hypothetical protein
MKRGILFFVLLMGSFMNAQEPPPAGATVQRHQAELAQVSVYREKAADLHPAFAKTYPVALIEDGQLTVFEPGADGRSWAQAAQTPVKPPMPVGIKAAMPLGFWGNRMACVVTPEIFSVPEGYAVILHEFVHCYEWETVEGKLKQGLIINQEAMARRDFMWELAYPFPYGNAEVKRVYGLWLAALEKGMTKKAGHWRSVLRKGLNSRDWEYMTWQEWKEGLARYLENLVRGRFGMGINRPLPGEPFDRITFYRGGELFISRLREKKPGLDKNIESLYRRIFTSGS